MSSRANKDRHQLTPILLYAADIYYSQTSISRNFAHPHTSTFVEHVPEHKIKTILQNKPIRVVYNKKKDIYISIDNRRLSIAKKCYYYRVHQLPCLEVDAGSHYASRQLRAKGAQVMWVQLRGTCQPDDNWEIV